MKIPYKLYLIHTTNLFCNSMFNSVEPFDELSEDDLDEIYQSLRNQTPDIIKENGYETDNEVYEWDDQIYELSVKHCAELTPEQYQEYCEDCAFSLNENTAGALTVEYGLLPAICIEEEKSTGYETFHSSYVSIIPKSDEFDNLLKKANENSETTLKKFQRLFSKEVDQLFEKVGDMATEWGDGKLPSYITLNTSSINQKELEL